MANDKLAKAKEAKFDEFYTQYADIQKEVNAYGTLHIQRATVHAKKYILTKTI